MINVDGSLFCVGAPLDSAVLSGPAIGKPPVLAQPSLDSSDAVERIVVASLDLDQLKWIAVALPQGATLTRDGVRRLYRAG